MNTDGTMKLLTGSSNPELAKKVAAYLGVPITPMDVRRFADGEVICRIHQKSK